MNDYELVVLNTLFKKGRQGERQFFVFGNCKFKSKHPESGSRCNDRNKTEPIQAIWLLGLSGTKVQRMDREIDKMLVKEVIEKVIDKTGFFVSNLLPEIKRMVA